jgi:hypothetical protein
MIILAGVALLTSCTKEVDVSGKIIYKYIEEGYYYEVEVPQVEVPVDNIIKYQPTTYNLVTVDTTNHTTYKVYVDSASYLRYEIGNYYQGKKRAENKARTMSIMVLLLFYLPLLLLWLGKKFDSFMCCFFGYSIGFLALLAIIVALIRGY